MDDNRRKAFADVVSLDAWHDGFAKKKKVDLHVDVAFGTARVGGETDATVRFRLSLKRAEVVIVVPGTEPVMVDKASVTRIERSVKVKVKNVDKRQSQTKIEAGAAIEVGLGVSGPKTKAHAKAAALAAASRDQSSTVTREGSDFVVNQSRTHEDDYRWIITSNLASTPLDGHPWDADTAPRLKLVDTRPDRERSLPPSVRVQVRCLREDLEITHLELKDEEAWSLISKSKQHRNRLVAAEALIKARLFAAGLVVGDLNEPYAQLTLAEVSVGDD